MGCLISGVTSRVSPLVAQFFCTMVHFFGTLYNSALTRQGSFGESKHHMNSHGTCCQEFVSLLEKFCL